MNNLVGHLAVALAIGLLVGLERGWREREDPSGSRTAGFRTFGLFGLLGGLAAALSQEMASPTVFAVTFLAFAAIFALFQFNESRHDGSFSVTSTIAGLTVFVLGAMAVAGDYRVAAAAGTALAALLASREVLHRALRSMTWVEIRSALVLAAMTTIILPLLPNRTVDPWGGLNPHEIWLFTVLIAAISFFGYAAVRILGPRRGLLVSGLAGAVVSSTAVTAALARMSKGHDSGSWLAGAAALAGTISILRVSAVVLLLRPDVFGMIAPVTLGAAAALAALGTLLLLARRGQAGTAEVPANPFELKALLVFATFFAIVATASAALVARFGGSSLMVSSALSGMFDVDVAVLSSVRMVAQGITPGLAGSAVLVALVSNGFGRMLLSVVAGRPAFWVPLSACIIAAALFGLGIFLAIGPEAVSPGTP